MDRVDLGAELKTIIPNVYYQPPEALKLQFPCIVYDLIDEVDIYSNNGLYKTWSQYRITIMDKNPDSVYPKLLKSKFTCSFERKFTSSYVNHIVYTLHI